MRSALSQCSKIQKYSPTESAKVYDKAVNRKSSVIFSPRQTVDFLHHDEMHDELTYELKRKIVKQYLDVSHNYFLFNKNIILNYYIKNIYYIKKII